MHDPLPPCPKFLVNLVKPYCDALNLTTLPNHIHEFLGAFLLYHIVNVYVSPALSPRLFPTSYRSFNKRTRINWNVHVVSLVQSVLICGLSFYALFAEDERNSMDSEQRIWGYTGYLGMIQALGAGYFAWDLMVSAQYVNIFGIGFLAHAICALCVFMLGFRPFVNYYAPTFLLYELSSPFVNFHWFMDKLQMTGSNLQLINGICLLIVFFGCRLVAGPYSSLRVGLDIYQAWSDPPAHVLARGLEVPLWLALTYVVSNSILNFLNFYWFGKMIDALRRRFDTKASDKSSSLPTELSTSEGLSVIAGEDGQVIVEGTDIKIPSMILQQQGEIRQRK